MGARLPKYVFRQANGSYRYKRNVPRHLQVLLGKSTLYRQLGDSYQEAMQNLPWVHARIETLFTSENEKSARKRSLGLIRGALGDELAELVLAGQVPEHFTASLVGHHSSRSANRLTYGLYSVRISDAQKREIVDQVRLPGRLL